MDKSSESSESLGANSQVARLHVSQANSVTGSTEQFQRAVPIVTEHNYTMPVQGKESSGLGISLHDVSGKSQDDAAGESGRRYATAIRRIQNISSVRRDSSRSSSSSSDSSSNSSSSGSGSNTSNGSTSASSSSSTSCSSVRDSSQEAHISVGSNITDAILTQFGDKSNEEIKASVASEVQSSDVFPHEQQKDAPVLLDKTTIHNINKKKTCRLKSLSDSSSSSSSSSSSKNCDRPAVEGLRSNQFKAFTPELNQAYLKAVDPREEKRREENTWEVIRECIKAVESRFCYLRSLSGTVLGDKYTPRDLMGKSDVDTSTSDLDISDNSSIYEQRLGVVEACLSDAYVEIATIEKKETEIPIPKPSTGLLGEYSKEYIREVIKMDAGQLDEETTSSEEHGESVHSRPGIQAEEGESASDDEEEEGIMECDENSYDAKQRLQTWESAQISLNRAVQDLGILSKIGSAAEQYLSEAKEIYGILLSCMNCMINVVGPAVEAERVAQVARIKASSLDPATSGAVVHSAVNASRFAQSAVSAAEEAVEFHADAVGALSDAETSLDEIHVDKSICDDLVLEMSLTTDGVDMLAREMSGVTVEELQDQRDIVKFKAGSLSCALRSSKMESACVEQQYKNCDVARLQLLSTLLWATHSSVNALDAARSALEVLSTLNRPVSKLQVN